MGNLDNLEAFNEMDRGSVDKQRKLIRALTMPYETVYGVSMDTGLCTCYRMSESMNEFYDDVNIESDYEENIRRYVGKDVLDEDKCLFDDICSIRQVKRIFFRKQMHYINYRVLRNGRIRYLQCLLVKPDNEENEFAVAFKDINEEKKLEIAQQQRIEEAVEEARRANRAKTVFLSNMSHDIRTPMNGIIGMTAIAASHVDDRERVLDSLKKISMASKHLLNLINEVLDMSKIESGKVELKDYLVYLPKGAGFQPNSYLKSFDYLDMSVDLTRGVPANITVRHSGDVDTSTPGVYAVKYNVECEFNQRKFTGFSKLIVVVEE